MKRIVVGISGASGALYARRLCQILVGEGCRVHAVISAHGRSLLEQELGLEVISPTSLLAQADGRNLTLHEAMNDALASGSMATDGMVICPCSCNTLSAMACGRSDTLLTRAAQVHLKERRPLVLVVREMPVSAVDLENELRLARAGAVIAPACPGFYTQPQTAAELVDFVAHRAARLVGVTPAGGPTYGRLE